jgi:hypothetical protein
MDKDMMVRRTSIMDDEKQRRESVLAMTSNVTGE